MLTLFVANSYHSKRKNRFVPADPFGVVVFQHQSHSTLAHPANPGPPAASNILHPVQTSLATTEINSWRPSGFRSASAAREDATVGGELVTGGSSALALHAQGRRERTEQFRKVEEDRQASALREEEIQAREIFSSYTLPGATRRGSGVVVDRCALSIPHPTTARFRAPSGPPCGCRAGFLGPASHNRLRCKNPLADVRKDFWCPTTHAHLQFKCHVPSSSQKIDPTSGEKWKTCELPDHRDQEVKRQAKGAVTRLRDALRRPGAATHDGDAALQVIIDGVRESLLEDSNGILTHGQRDEEYEALADMLESISKADEQPAVGGGAHAETTEAKLTAPNRTKLSKSRTYGVQTFVAGCGIINNIHELYKSEGTHEVLVSFPEVTSYSLLTRSHRAPFLEGFLGGITPSGTSAGYYNLV
ncbi:hypothetical protein P7C70_g7437, partial [Phenoliferia sp. Uapishka_3]